MSDTATPSSGPDAAGEYAEERAELRRVLDSGAFDRSPILSRLLVHVCERTFAGLQGQLKESTIAVEVFRRPADFDSRQDPIVRVNANRLREALARFYVKRGRQHPVQITVPPGQYVPVFRPVPGRETGEAPAARPAGPPTVEPEPAADLPESQPTRQARSSWWLLVAAVLAGALLGQLTWLGGSRTRGGADLVPQPTATFEDSGVRILAGSSQPVIDAFGRLWSADAYYTGGTAVATREASAGIAPVYRAYRKGHFSYDVPLAPGCYELHLHFIEAEFGNASQGGETSRLFDVELNGTRVLRMFDVIADAGGSRTPDEKVLTDVSPAPDGRLHLRFPQGPFEAVLSGIEILPGTPGKMRPIRISAQRRPFVSADGLLWSPDHFARGGETVMRTQRVLGTSRDPGLFRAERFGNFRYTIPVAPGRYALTLYFAETFFGTSNGVRTGIGARAFDVFCNGQALLRDLDVMKEAGGENRPLMRTFGGLAPNAQGKLILDFVPVRNLATLSALEVVAE